MTTRAELIQFNEAVRAWAERFQPPRVRRFAEVMGKLADAMTHVHYNSYEGIAAAYRKRHRRDIGYNTVWRYLTMLEGHEIITVERRKWGPDDEHPGAQRNNLYTVRFDRVLTHGRVVKHDFYGATGLNLNVSSEQMGSGLGSGMGSGMEPGVEPLRSRRDLEEI